MAYAFTRIAPIGDSDPQAMPVKDSEAAARFYADKLGFTIKGRQESPAKGVLIGRDGIEIRLVENGEDPEQASCYIAVDDVDAAHREIQAAGVHVSDPRIDRHNGGVYKVFFVKDEEGLCYCIGKRED